MPFVIVDSNTDKSEYPSLPPPDAYPSNPVEGSVGGPVDEDA